MRRRLIDELVLYARNRGHRLTVVFDGWKDGKGHETSLVSGGITIIYSGIGEKADNVIKRIISTERRKWIVVSSDREIASFAWRMNSVPIRSDLFREVLEQALGNDEEDLLDRSPLLERRGGYGKKSKKEREIDRVLSKL